MPSYNVAMNYYEVMVASASFHGQDSLTYSSKDELQTGVIVQVPMRNGSVSAIVGRKVNRPNFTTKEIISVQVDQPIPATTLALIDWLARYYPSTSGLNASQFIPGNLLKKPAAPPAVSDSRSSVEPLPALTGEQQAAIDIINQLASRSFLIHGDTGTGKTRLYIELVKDALGKKQSAVVLTPEIGLTSQLADTVAKHIGQEVLIFHSNLTGQQRRELWLKALMSTEPLVVVGPRSALFLPLASIGLIVVDEAHDSAYKQDQAPRYHALRVAAKLAEIHSARLILGTATPLINEYYFATSKQVPIIRLQELAAGPSEPVDISMVDAHDRSQYSRHSYLSDTMLSAIELALANNQQSLVFLNRRGTARLVICQNCDWQAVCPNCNLPLTYHGDHHLMRCHTCGYKAPAVSSCPVCSSPDIVFKSIGTKAIAAALESIFPNARVKRFDTDNTKQERLEQHFQAVKSGEIDILVGTQLLVKGLDLPKLSTVGVVAADTSLYFPDYTAEEQTYQLISQVIGRVGRGHQSSNRVVIQTYNPDSPALTAAISKDWDIFYQTQLDDRRLHKFPPFYHYLKLYCGRKTADSAIKAATKLKGQLLDQKFPIEIIGPTPRFNEQSGGLYNWQLIVRAKQRQVLTTIARDLPANWNYDLDPLNLL